MEIRPRTGPVGVSPTTETLSNILNSANTVSSVAAFTMTWAATAFLLQHYSKKIGNARYWIILSLPLTYFVGQFQPTGIQTSLTEEDMKLYLDRVLEEIKGKKSP